MKARFINTIAIPIFRVSQITSSSAEALQHSEKHSKMKAAFVLLAGAALASAQTVYFIRHGEKPSDDSDPNLSAQGQERAQCLRTVFGASSQYNIGYIIAEKPKGE